MRLARSEKGWPMVDISQLHRKRKKKNSISLFAFPVQRERGSGPAHSNIPITRGSPSRGTPDCQACKSPVDHRPAVAWLALPGAEETYNSMSCMRGTSPTASLVCTSLILLYSSPSAVNVLI